jgi:hypothetical protein
MFPNFKSLAQREEKRHELLEKAERRKRQATQKRAMYESTMWATDADKTLNVASKPSTSSDSQVNMTAAEIEAAIANADPTKDRVLIANLVKKKLSGLTEGAIPAEVDSKYTTVPPAEPSVPTSASARVKRTILKPASNAPETNDLGFEDTTVESDVPDFDIFDVNSDSSSNPDHGISPIDYVKSMYKAHIDLVSMRLSPIDKMGRSIQKYYIGEKGFIYRFDNNNQAKTKLVNWIKTAELVKQKYDELENRRNNQNTFMSEEFKDTSIPKEREKQKKASMDNYKSIPISGLKRKSDDSHEDGVRKSDVIFINEADKETDTSSDEDASKAKLKYMLKQYDYKLRDTNLKLQPVIKTGNILTREQLQGNIVKIVNGDIMVVGQLSDKPREAVARNVAWGPTLRRFINLANFAGIVFEAEPSKDKVIYAKDTTRFDGSDEGSRLGVKVGPDANTKFDMNTHLTNFDIDAEKVLQDYYIKLMERGLKIPFKLHPIMGSGDSIAENSKYFINDAFIPSLTSDNKPLSGRVLAMFHNKTNWSLTFESMIHHLENLLQTGSKMKQIRTFRDTMQ